MASRISCSFAQNGVVKPVDLISTALTRRSTFALRRLSTIARTVGVRAPLT